MNVQDNNDIRKVEALNDVDKSANTDAATNGGHTKTRNSLMGLLRSASSKAVTPITSKSKPTRMLTRGQLSDLFRRLDKDGNGYEFRYAIMYIVDSFPESWTWRNSLKSSIN